MKGDEQVDVDKRRDSGAASTAASPPPVRVTGPLSGQTSIRTPDRRVRVFISSTLGELAPERAAAKEAVDQLRLTPVLFEAGARPHPALALYRAYLAQSDIFIGIYWQRYGAVAPGMEVSGLEDEYGLSGDMPRLIYFKTPAPQREPRLQAMLDRIRADAVTSYRHFATAAELRDLVADDLATLLTERFAGPAAPRPPERPAPLPAPRGTLVDRAQEADATRALLQRDDVGLVTLAGPGGVGKTRVAVQVATDLAPRFADGVAFVALDTLADPAQLAATIARVLGIPDAGGQPIEGAMLAYLRARQMLLLLDNVEQVIAAAPVAMRALDVAPRLKILATSREPLRVREERIVPIPPLCLPDPDPPPTLEELALVPAVALFVARAREFQPSFALTDENAAAVADICRRLDGLPLALELAAARLATLSPQALLAHLGRRLPLLTRGARDMPARQRTLRDTIAWSYDLLADGEKALFRALSVFAGGFTLDAVEAVCLGHVLPMTSPVGGDAGGEVLDGVASLIEKSLLYPVRGVAEGSRFVMLETIREFAAEQMAAAGEATTLRRRHALYFVSLAEAALPHLARPDRGAWIERLHSEDPNFRAALTWTSADDKLPAAAPARRTGVAPEHDAGGDVASAEDSATLPDHEELGLRLAGALGWHWVGSGQLQEGRGWLEKLLARSKSDDHSAARGRAQYSASLLAWAQGDIAAASSWAEAAVANARARGDASLSADANAQLGVVRMSQGEARAARSLLEGSRAAFHKRGDIANEAYTLYFLARAVAMSGEFAESRTLAEAGLALFIEMSDPVGRALALSALGGAAMAQGDNAKAVACFAEGLPLMRAAGGLYFLAQFLVEAGRAWLGEGDGERARRLLAESLGLWRDIGRPDGVALALAGLAEVAAAQGQPRRAARLLGAAGALPSAPLAARSLYLRAPVDRAVAAARAALGEDAYNAARAEGAALTQEQAIAEALDESTPSGPGGGAHG